MAYGVEDTKLLAVAITTEIETVKASVVAKALASVSKGHGMGAHHPAPFDWHYTKRHGDRHISIWGALDGDCAVILAIGGHSAPLEYTFQWTLNDTIPGAVRFTRRRRRQRRRRA